MHGVRGSGTSVLYIGCMVLGSSGTCVLYIGCMIFWSSGTCVLYIGCIVLGVAVRLSYI